MLSHRAIAAISPSPCPRLLRRHRSLPSSPAAAPTPAPASGSWHQGICELGARRALSAVCGARRRVRYDDEEEDDDEEYGHNEEMAMLERYSEGVRDQALLVKARVDDEVEAVLVFKGFSSSLSGRTASDPARSVLPQRAIIQSIDVVKGPFDPNNVEFLEKGLAWDDFQSRLQ